MAFSYTPTYVTWVEFKDETIVASLASISEADYDKLAKRTEYFVDNYVGRQCKYDETQTRQFPRDVDIDTDGDSAIPEEVKIASIRITESLSLDGETKAPKDNAMKSEKIADYSYSRDKSSSELNGLDLIPPEAKQLLLRFRRKSVQISPPSVGGGSVYPVDGALNSRQRFIKNNK